MLEWTTKDEEEFRRSVAVRVEIDATFSGYFFDQSLTYILLGPGASQVGFVSNLVHEMGHSVLADSPLGMLHHILFELVARCGETLYARALEPIMREHVEKPTAEQLDELRELEQGGQRDEAARQRVRSIADRAFRSARSELSQELFAKKHEPFLRLFRRVQERRRFLIQSSQVCHEAVAMFHQCGSHPSTAERYRRIASLVCEESGISNLVDEVMKHVAGLRQSLTGRWLKGMELSERILSETGEPRCVYLAAKLSHHVPCSNVSILSDDLEEFKKLASSTALHVDRRFHKLAERPDLLKELALSRARPIPIGHIQELLQAEILPDERAKPLKDLGDWIVRKVLEDSIVKAAGDLFADMVSGLRSFPVVSPYEAMHITKSIPPPILLTNGRVIGGLPNADRFLKRDFVRAEKVRILDRVLGRVTN